MEISERRAAHRYGLELPMVARRVPTTTENGVLLGKTYDISTCGICFTTDQRLAVDEVIDFSLKFDGLAQGLDVLVTGRARVVRLLEEPTVSEPRGIAAVIENFHIVEPQGGRG